ncbi:hypothetical protein SNEBB_000747, partial [Seison nebaliae]
MTTVSDNSMMEELKNYLDNFLSNLCSSQEKKEELELIKNTLCNDETETILKKFLETNDYRKLFIYRLSTKEYEDDEDEVTTTSEMKENNVKYVISLELKKYDIPASIFSFIKRFVPINSSIPITRQI